MIKRSRNRILSDNALFPTSQFKLNWWPFSVFCLLLDHTFGSGSSTSVVLPFSRSRTTVPIGWLKRNFVAQTLNLTEGMTHLYVTITTSNYLVSHHWGQFMKLCCAGIKTVRWWQSVWHCFSQVGQQLTTTIVREPILPTLPTETAFLFCPTSLRLWPVCWNSCRIRMLPSIEDRGQADHITMNATDCCTLQTANLQLPKASTTKGPSQKKQ